jgi:hypothetical protein
MTEQAIELTMNMFQRIAAKDRFGLTIGGGVCILLVVWMSRTLDVPAMPGRAGGLLQQVHWPVAIGVAWLALAVCAAIGTILASRAHHDGGLFCACVGLAALSVRMGPSGFALRAADGPSIYLGFAAELLLLYAALAVTWFVLHRLPHSGWAPTDLGIHESDPDETLDQKLIATGAQALITLILMMLLCQSDAKNQTLASVMIASYLGALGAHHLVPIRPSAWFWIGPLAVGLIGYIGQYFNPIGWNIGEARGLFAPLARPLPLDYAALGTAGALLGYWTSQRWHRERAEGEVNAQ